jgi:hypothetical protein
MVPLGSPAGAGLYTVSVRADVDDPDLSNNMVAPAVVVDRAARTDLALSFAPGEAAVGEVANVRLVVRNNGPDGPPVWSLSWSRRAAPSTWAASRSAARA